MKIYLVGGAVRDKIMGIPSHDRDYVVVGASIEEMLLGGFIPIGKSFPVFIKKGENGKEYALARKDIKIGPKHTDFHFIFDKTITLEEDLCRRDFTCNAIAYDEEQNKYIDCNRGLEDISNRMLRHINLHFCEDPLRVLRLCRFAAQLNFVVAPKTLELCQTMVLDQQLESLSAERIWNEIKRALQYPHFYRFVETAHECYALQFIMPALEKLWFTKDRSTEKMLIENTIDCLKGLADGSEVVKFAALLHNIGETESQMDSDFFDSEKLGVSIIKRLCQSLKIPTDYQKFAILTCRNYKNFSCIDSMNSEDLLDMIDLYMKKMPEHFDDFVASIEIGLKTFPGKINSDSEKSKEKIQKIYSILSGISARDMPNFDELEKDESFKDKYREFRLQILKRYF